MNLRWIPNAICVLRLLLIAPILIALFDNRYLLALTLMVFAGFSDALDGFLAKTFDWRTQLGGLLDPIADKLLVTSTFVMLAYLGLAPVGLTVVVVARDVIILGGAISYSILAGNLTGEPSLISKANTFFQLAFLALTIFDAEFGWFGPPWAVPLGAAVVFTSVTSGAGYVVEWSRRAVEISRAR